MLPKHFFRAARHFSNRRQTLLNFHLIYITGAGIFLLGYGYFNKWLVDPNSDITRSMHLKQLINSPSTYEGAPRPSEAEKILRNASHDILIVYGPSFSGKTHLMRYIHSIHKPSLLLEVQPKFSNTINFLDFPNKYEDSQIYEFFGVVEKSLKSFNDPLLIIDGYEKLEEVYQKMFLQVLNHWSNSKAIRIIITTSSEPVVNHLKATTKASFCLIEGISREDFHLALKSNKGYSFQGIEEMWNRCGDDFAYALDFLDTRLNPRDYLEEKKKEIFEALLCYKDNRVFIKDLKKALDMVDATRPLGDMFVATTLVQELIKMDFVNLFMQSAKFRNIFIIEVLKDWVKSLDRND